ncbi:type VII secretion integral membrane protein EccD [Pseudonocardia humida]|uniref:Type VII secretion integral membrane protein EccD n=1 Tax=Pseudonocardia humida TaxID=2800819 RepID=A0ABT0ZWA9_9PSEU|nr:type VII secretion integral membrane protein EccD [Pseudonocardia humida]MCO1654934.1 type VII secretion integral membrane protein EccD [Pseudonocardia humida]
MSTATTYCRLTVLAPRTRVDVALPADIPVAELVPMVLELVGEPAPGRPPRPWRLRGPAGGPLPAAATLAQLGVLDGEMLRLSPDGAAPAPPVFDDPVDALADTAAPMRAAQRRCLAALVLVVAGAAAAVLATGGIVGGLVAAAAAVVAVVAAGRLDDDRTAALVAAVAAVPLAAAAGWALLPAASGAARLLLAALAAGVTAAAGQVTVRVLAPALVAAVTAAVPTMLGCLAVIWFDAPPAATAVGVGVLAVVLGPLVPRAALRLSGLPRPVVPADGGELTDPDRDADVLPPDELAERAALARGYLAGLVAGCATVAAVGALAGAAATGSWAGPVLAGITAGVLGLRSRGFADPTPTCALLATSAATATGLVALLALADPVLAAPIGAAVLLLAAAAAVASLHRTRPAGSPVARRAVDFLEYGLTIAAVPVALAAMDLFTLASRI